MVGSYGDSMFSFLGFFFFFCFFLVVPVAYGSSRASGHMRVVAASLGHSHSHSNSGSEPHLQPDLHHSSQQHRILNPSREARDQTFILMDTRQSHFH